jgi:hypothetical protein
LGVDGSLTPWAMTAVGKMIANTIKAICLMQYLPTMNVGWSATVPSRFRDLMSPRHCDQLAVLPNALSSHSRSQRAGRQVPSSRGPRSSLCGLGFLCASGQDAGAGHVRGIPDALSHSGLRQESRNQQNSWECAHVNHRNDQVAESCRFSSKSKHFAAVLFL